MSKADEKAAREQRSATKLRENLKRRKGQAKARAIGTPDIAPAGAEKPPSGGAGGSKAS